jgi:ATP-dependent Zn protease
MNSKTKIVTAFGAALLCAVILIRLFTGQRESQPAITYTQFIQEVQAGRVMEVKIAAGNSGPDAANVRLKNGATVRTLLPLDYSGALATMQQAMVNVEIQDASTSPGRLLINAAPFLILLAIWVYFMTIGRPLLGRR